MRCCVADEGHRLPRVLFEKKGVEIYACPDCGCLMADTEFDHSRYEAASYYTMSHKTKEAIEREWGLRWRYILNTIVKYKRPSSLLDVGAGNGYFVALAVDGFAIPAKGLELSEREIAFAKDVVGVQLVRQDISQHDSDYDVVTSFNVIEHVPAPQEFVSALVARLEPRGILAISTPNPTCLHARLKGLRNWDMINPPHHINIFTRKALSILLQRHNLTEVRYETLSTYINPIRRIDTRNQLLRRLLFHTLRILDLGADHFVFLSKPDS